jgi:hypothetical protein
MPADTQGFQSVTHRGITVLYAACRSPRTNPQLVTYLIEHRGCNVNQPNGSACFGSLPQHALVQTLQEALSGTTAPQPSFVCVLLDVLKVLKSKGANMAMVNVYHKSALQEFLGLENQMKACPPVSNLVPEFLQVLSFLPTGPPPRFQSDMLKHKLEQAKASAQRPLRVTDAEFAMLKLHDSFIAAQVRRIHLA